jgi:hypothetical protein
MVASVTVSLGIYYGGCALLGIERLNWAAPNWTTKHVVLILSALLLGSLVALIAFAVAMTIKVRNEHLSDFFIILWQFLANGSLIWIFSIGMAMSFSLGKDQAKTAVLNFGAERASAMVIASGAILGLLEGFAFFIALHIRGTLIAYFILSASAALLAAHWHYGLYAIAGNAWIVVGSANPVCLLFFALPMIARDRQQRRLAIEELA